MRPEAGSSGGPEWCGEVDEGFEPWRPGDPTTGVGPDGMPLEQARGFEGSHRPLNELADRIGRGEPTPETPAGRARPGRAPAPERKPFRWSEDSRRYQQGDRVRAAEALGDGIMRTVPDGTKGEVVDSRMGLLSGERFTVQFENGYRLENVERENLERRGWLD